ncbi:MAG: glutamate racemase [Pseudomonadota bacterium]
MTELEPNRSILVFDSGVGGLSVLKEARIIMPDFRYIYVADDAAFPYGAWEEGLLVQRLIALFDNLIDEYAPGLIVIGCNTASTIGIQPLRDAFPDQTFVGTVPAIKPAAERTRSGLVSVLATPGTVKRQYTRDLISRFATKCHVRLVGTESLAQLAEDYMQSGFVSEEAVFDEVKPCFLEQDDQRTDIVVLACTHYPFLVNRMRKVAPWPVDWLDTSEAIARRSLTLVDRMEFVRADAAPDVAIFTSRNPGEKMLRLVQGFGLSPA